MNDGVYSAYVPVSVFAHALRMQTPTALLNPNPNPNPNPEQDPLALLDYSKAPPQP